MLVLAIAGLGVVVPLAISLALYRTPLWWLAGALVLAAAVYVAMPAFAATSDDDWMPFADFARFSHEIAAAALALWAAIVLAITHLARRGLRVR